MELTRKTQRNQTVISLNGECTIYEAADLKPKLVDDCKGLNKTVLLNLAQVSDLDCAGVQLLLMLRKQIMAEGGTLQLQASNESVDRVLETLRLELPFQASEGAQ